MTLFIIIFNSIQLVAYVIIKQIDAYNKRKYIKENISDDWWEKYVDPVRPKAPIGGSAEIDPYFRSNTAQAFIQRYGEY